MVTRRDYENACKNASEENTKVSDDEGYLNQRLNMDRDWLRSFSGVGPFSVTRRLPFPWFCTDSRFSDAGRLPSLEIEDGITMTGPLNFLCFCDNRKSFRLR